MVTSEVRDGKLYLLCFEELAKFLVDKSRYTVLFTSYNRPAIKVTKENYDWCNKLFKKAEGTSDCNFLIELGLPLLEITTTENHNGLSLSINSTPKYNRSFCGQSFDSVEVWREKEIEKRLNKLGSYLELDRIRKEVDDELKQLPL